MTWPNSVRETITRLNSVKQTLKNLFVDRREVIDLLALAVVCRENLLVVGPPGTAKTAIIDRFTDLLDMRGFHYLLTRFTEPSELFGPLDLAEFQEGNYHIRTAGMLPDAQVAFLDEVFQGSSAILNSLLTLINERVFYNGSQRERVPLVCLIGAANTVPDDGSLRAFADRFVLRAEVAKVGDELVEDLLDHGWELERERIEAEADGDADPEMAGVKNEDVLALHRRLLEVNMGQVRAEYAQVVREIRAEGVELSDRRAVRGLKLVAGAALLRKADVAVVEDMWPLLHIWSRPEEADVLKTVVRPRLAENARMDTTRSPADILLDLETLESQEVMVASETAMGAHLMALNKLRRETIQDHPRDRETRARIETTIRRCMEKMEAVYV